MIGRRTIVLVALLPTLFLTAGLRAWSADDGPPKCYPSPKAVFDAYREARTKQDMRTTFSLMTRKAQDGTVLAAYLVCAMRDGEGSEERAFLKRSGLDDATLTSDLRREYKAKHGVEPANDKAAWDELEERYKAEHGVPPHSFYVVMCDLLSRRIKDKVGFCVEAATVIRHSPTSPLGELEGVVVKGDEATGRAATPSPVAAGQVPGSKGTYDRTFDFQKVDGGWLLDTYDW